MRRALSALAALAALAAAPGCTVDAVTKGDVIELGRVCPGTTSTTCAAVADGFSPITVEACVPASVEDRRTDLIAHFTVSAGRWDGVPVGDVIGTELDVNLGSDRCARATFVPDARPQAIRVQASWLGYTESLTLDLAGAPLGAIEIPSKELRFLPDGTFVLEATAVPALAGARVSTGTTVRYVVDGKTKVPATAQVLPAEDGRQVDAAGAAKFTLVASSSLESVTVELIATPPATSAGTPASVSRTLIIQGPPAVAATQ